MTAPGKIEPPQPGFHPGTPGEVMARWDAASFSRLKHMDESPRHVWEYMTHPPDPSSEMEFGSAMHCALLEPERFERDYFRAPEGDKRTKAIREEWAALEAEHPHATGIKGGRGEGQYDSILAIRDALWANPLASKMLADPRGTNEAAFLWEDPATGILLKGLADRVGYTPDGWPAVIDLKSMSGIASPERIERAIRDYRYHVQGAHYLDGLNVIAPLKRRWILILIEKKAPHGIRIVEVDAGSMELGRRKLRQWIDGYARCLESGKWPSYPAAIETMGVPAWEFEREAREMEP